MLPFPLSLSLSLSLLCAAPSDNSCSLSCLPYTRQSKLMQRERESVLLLVLLHSLSLFPRSLRTCVRLFCLSAFERSFTIHCCLYSRDNAIQSSTAAAASVGNSVRRIHFRSLPSRSVGLSATSNGLTDEAAFIKQAHYNNALAGVRRGAFYCIFPHSCPLMLLVLRFDCAMQLRTSILLQYLLF